MNTDYFHEKGRALLANGYLIIPIKPGEKRPALSAWQSARMTLENLAKYPEHGIGILTGQGTAPIVGIDVDISHPTIGPAMINACRKHLGWAPERIGAAPRMMLVYRAAEAGWVKRNSASFFDPTDPTKPSGKRNDQMVEVLGLGQQFVSYGVHPDTGQSYQWVDLLGGLEHVAVDDLPVITQAQIDTLFAELDRLVRSTAGLENVSAPASMPLSLADEDDALLRLTGKCPDIDLAGARDVLARIPNDPGVSYDEYLQVGMSLHHQFDGSPEALALFSEWSALSPKHVAGEAERKWRSFGKPGKHDVTFRFAIKLASTARAQYNTLKDRTDTGNANLLCQLTNGNLRYIFETKRWAYWDGNAWSVDDAGVLIQREALRVAEHYLTKAQELDLQASDTSLNESERKRVLHAAKGLRGWAMACRNKSKIDAMLAVAARDVRIALSVSQLDCDPWLFGVGNGVVDLRDGTLRPAAREDFVTKRSKFSYDANAKAPRFAQFIREITGLPRKPLVDAMGMIDPTTVGLFDPRADYAAYIQKACGYAMSGTVREHKMFIAVGAGSNGKNILLDTLQEVAGDYVRTIPPEALMTTRHEGDAERPSPVMASLAGARLAVSSESRDGQRLDVALVKRHTGGGFMTARLMRENTFKFGITHKLWLMTNHMPQLDHMDEAMRGRLHVLPFDRVWNRPGHPDPDPSLPNGDKTLMDTLRGESVGILTWLVQGAHRYHAEGLEPPAVVVGTTRSYFDDSDVLGQWLATCDQCEPKNGMRAGELLESFRLWCRCNGLNDDLKLKAFSMALSGRRIAAVDRKDGKHFGLKDKPIDLF